MLPIDSDGRAPIKLKYLINIDSGFLAGKCGGEYAVQVRFAGNVLRTKSVRHSGSANESLHWNEQIRFYGMLPSMCQTFIVQLMVIEICAVAKCFAECEINFSEMTNNIHGPEGDMIIDL